MLRTLDRILTSVTWLAAAPAVVALLVGPEVIGAKDETAPAHRPVAAVVQSGSGSMPGFAGDPTTEQIDAVAEYVSTAAGG